MFKNGFFGNVIDAVNNTAQTAEDITAKPFFVCTITSIILGFLISLIYMATHKKEGYSQSYVLTMIMLPPIVALILLLIHTTYGALSIAGALTLVRFRSIPGDPRDITYIFYSMATGVACGLGYIGFAVAFFIIIGIVTLVLNYFDFGGCKINHMTLKVSIPENLDYQGLFDDTLKKYTSYYKLRRVKTSNFGTLFELIYSVDVYNDINQKKFIDEIRALNGNLTVNLVYFKYDDKVYEN
ncbi:MAG: DUF4956 domain-containing protein [Oscillospiraceae bacterium]|nr:DUF4956 domain-containing protein [Oscillospiraceae bacterium]